MRKTLFYTPKDSPWYPSNLWLSTGDRRAVARAIRRKKLRIGFVAVVHGYSWVTHKHKSKDKLRPGFYIWKYPKNAGGCPPTSRNSQ